MAKGLRVQKPLSSSDVQRASHDGGLPRPTTVSGWGMKNKFVGRPRQVGMTLLAYLPILLTMAGFVISGVLLMSLLMTGFSDYMIVFEGLKGAFFYTGLATATWYLFLSSVGALQLRQVAVLPTGAGVLDLVQRELLGPSSRDMVQWCERRDLTVEVVKFDGDDGTGVWGYVSKLEERIDAPNTITVCVDDVHVDPLKARWGLLFVMAGEPRVVVAAQTAFHAEASWASINMILHDGEASHWFDEASTGCPRCVPPSADEAYTFKYMQPSSVHEAAALGDTDDVADALKSDPEAKAQLDRGLPGVGVTPLHVAVAALGSDVQDKYYHPEDGLPWLAEEEVVLALLEAGACPIVEDAAGNTPMSLAEKIGNEDMRAVVMAAIQEAEVRWVSRVEGPEDETTTTEEDKKDQ